VISADGRSLRQITRDEAIDFVPDWSPDGTQLVFASNRTGRHEIYVISVEEGEPAGETPRQLTHDGGTWPRWSPTGGWIAFVHDDGVGVVSEDGSETRYLVENSDVSWVSWSGDGQTVYYRALNSQGTSFWSVPVSGGEPILLVRRFHPGVYHPPFYASGAGRFFFTLTEHESDIWVMELEPPN
jgi:TolB protein